MMGKLYTGTNPKLEHVPILQKTLQEIHPSPENEKLYKPVLPDDPEVQKLAKSIQEYGIMEPLVVTQDGWILSGHRRFVAARLLGLARVPCRVEAASRQADPDKFCVLLREYNRQRIKSFDEKLREEIVSCDPTEAYKSLIDYRTSQRTRNVETIEIEGRTRRARISEAKVSFLQAIQHVLKDRREFWPLSDRQIHYALLNDPPLKHASKADSIYTNTRQSYQNLTNLLTRARLDGLIPMEAIADETRPEMIWTVCRDVQLFLGDELEGFLKGYWRDLLQSQPDHIEIIGEKNTILSVVKPVAMEYCIPLTIGRGYCSLPPRHKIATRYHNSGKERLFLLALSDFDPDGEEIAHSLARSLRDDFGIEKIEPVKVALNSRQVEEYKLPPIMQAKEKSSNYRKFTARYGHDVFELEAIPPRTLQNILRQVIDSVLDTELFNRELEEEKRDAGRLAAIRRTVSSHLMKSMIP